METPIISQGIMILLMVLSPFLLGAIAVPILYKEYRTSRYLQVCLLLAAPVGGYLMIYFMVMLEGIAKVNKEWQIMAQRQLPRTRQELLKKLDPAKENPTAQQYRKLCEKFYASIMASRMTDLLDDNDFEYNFAKWQPPAQQQLETLLNHAEIRDITAEITRLSAEPISIDQVWFDDGWNTPFDRPEMPTRRCLIRLIQTESWAAAIRSDLPRSYNLIRCGYRMIRQMDCDAFLFPQLCNQAFVSVNSITLDDLVKKYGIPENSARELLEELDKFDVHTSLGRALTSDLAWQNVAFDEAMQELHSPWSTPKFKRIKANPFLLGLDPTCYHQYAQALAWLREVRDCAEPPYWETAERRKKCQEDIKNMSAFTMEFLFPTSMPTIITKMARQESEINVAKLTLALYLYRHRHGSFPDKLEALVPSFRPSIPLDPLNGKTYKYRRENNGFTLSGEWQAERYSKYKKKKKTT